MTEQKKPQSTLRKLATRIPDKYIGQNHAKKDAADHTVITQLLLLHVGPYSFEVVRELYSIPKKGDEPVLNGIVGRLTCTVDGKEVRIEEAGGVENPGNQDGDGERLKLACSDAIKRCAMRLGLGLHIWAQGHYFLDRYLAKREEDAEGSAAQDLPDPDPGNPPQEDVQPAQRGGVPGETSEADDQRDTAPTEGEDPPADNDSEDDLPDWLKEEEPAKETDVKEMQGAAKAAAASGVQQKETPSASVPENKDDAAITDEQVEALVSLTKQLRGEDGVQLFQKKNGEIAKLTYGQARKHIRELSGALQRKRKKEKDKK